MPLARIYLADKMYKKPQLRGKWFTDTIDRRVISKNGNRYGQVFANRGFFTHIYPMDTKRKAGDTLHTFCQEFGVPWHVDIWCIKGARVEKDRVHETNQENDIDFHVLSLTATTRIPAKEWLEKLDASRSEPWYVTDFPEDYGTMGCNGFAKPCKELLLKQED